MCLLRLRGEFWVGQAEEADIAELHARSGERQGVVHGMTVGETIKMEDSHH